MRSHHLSRAVLASAVVMFFVSLDTFAQYQPPAAGDANGGGGFPIGFGAAATTSSPATTPGIPVAPVTTLPAVASDLVASGFTDPAAVAATASGYLAPVAYFRGKETVMSIHPEWGAAADLVAVSVHAVADPAWTYNGGQPEIVNLAGRTQVRVSKPGFYIVVTGPDANKTVALANLLKNR